MSEKPKAGPNWSLLMPAILLLVEILALIVIYFLGYTITQNILYLFSALGIFLVYRVVRQLIAISRINKAITQLKSVDELVDSGQPMAAIKRWKKLLLNLPRDKYLEVLTRIEKIYQQEDMPKAAKDAKLVYAESIEFFEAISGADSSRHLNRQDWQDQAVLLRNMIRALPEEKE